MSGAPGHDELLANMQSMIQGENKVLRESITTDILTQLTAVVNEKLDERAKQIEDKLMAAIRAVGERTSSLEAQFAAAPRPEEGGDRKRPCREVSSSATASTAAPGSADLRSSGSSAFLASCWRPS